MNLGGAIHINRTGCVIILATAFLLLLYITSNRNDVDKQNVNSQVNLKDILITAVFATENGGQQVKRYADNFTIESKGETKEGSKISVTTADFKSHCAMLGIFKQRYPKLKIVSEESGTKCNSKDEYDSIIDSKKTEFHLDDTWVEAKDIQIWIDPLDATQEYTGKEFFC